MAVTRFAGILSIILGLIFIIFPMFSIGLVSLIVGLSLLFFGISAIFLGWNMRDGAYDIFPMITIIIGVIAVIFGFLFLFYIETLPFLMGIQFYIVGFIMIVFGIAGLLAHTSRVPTFSSVLVLIMGIAAIAIAIFTVEQPIYIAIIIGIVLIIEGISMILLD